MGFASSFIYFLKGIVQHLCSGMNVVSSQSLLASVSQKAVKTLHLKLQVFFGLHFLLQTGMQIYICII